MRRWKNDPVPPQLIEKLVDAARWAPSTCNLQTWRFLVLAHEGARKFIGKIHRRYSWFLKDAPLIIVILTDVRPYYHAVGRGFVKTPAKKKVAIRSSCYDAGACIQNLLLTAHGLGLGGCWCFWDPSTGDEEKFREVFGIPNYMIIHASIGIGYPDTVPTPPARRPLTEILVWDDSVPLNRASCSVNEFKWQISGRHASQVFGSNCLLHEDVEQETDSNHDR